MFEIAETLLNWFYSLQTYSCLFFIDTVTDLLHMLTEVPCHMLKQLCWRYNGWPIQV